MSLNGLLEDGKPRRPGDPVRERQHIEQLLLWRCRVQANDLGLRRHVGVCCVGVGASFCRQLHVIEVLGLIRVRVYLGVLEERHHIMEDLILLDVPRHDRPELKDKHVLLLVLEQDALVGYDLDRRNPLQRQLGPDLGQVVRLTPRDAHHRPDTLPEETCQVRRRDKGRMDDCLVLTPASKHTGTVSAARCCITFNFADAGLMVRQNLLSLLSCNGVG